MDLEVIFMSGRHIIQYNNDGGNKFALRTPWAWLYRDDDDLKSCKLHADRAIYSWSWSCCCCCYGTLPYIHMLLARKAPSLIALNSFKEPALAYWLFVLYGESTRKTSTVFKAISRSRPYTHPIPFSLSLSFSFSSLILASKGRKLLISICDFGSFKIDWPMFYDHLHAAWSFVCRWSQSKSQDVIDHCIN